MLKKSEGKLFQQTLWVVYSLSNTKSIDTKGKLKGMPWLSMNNQG